MASNAALRDLLLGNDTIDSTPDWLLDASEIERAQPSPDPDQLSARRNGSFLLRNLQELLAAYDDLPAGTADFIVARKDASLKIVYSGHVLQADSAQNKQYQAHVGLLRDTPGADAVLAAVFTWGGQNRPTGGVTVKRVASIAALQSVIDDQLQEKQNKKQYRPISAVDSFLESSILASAGDLVAANS